MTDATYRISNMITDILPEKQQERTRSNIAYLSDKLRGVTFVEQRNAPFTALSDEQQQEMLANSRAPNAADGFACRSRR